MVERLKACHCCGQMQLLLELNLLGLALGKARLTVDEHHGRIDPSISIVPGWHGATGC